MSQRKKSVRKVSTKRFKRIKFCRNSYSIKKKQQVISYAIKNGRNKATRHFNFDSNMVSKWIKASKEQLERNQNIKKVGSERKEFFSEAEKKLYD